MKRLLRPETYLLALLPLLASGCHRPVAAEAGGQAVPMVVLKSRRGDTMALVPIYINGQGPFAFALDTGASHSVVDGAIAQKLQLEPAGPSEEVSGVGGIARAVPVRVNRWRVGDVVLPSRTLSVVDLSQNNRHAGFHGLLGSDMLSKFDVVIVDYQNQRLVFRPPQKGLQMVEK